MYVCVHVCVCVCVAPGVCPRLVRMWPRFPLTEAVAKIQDVTPAAMTSLYITRVTACTAQVPWRVGTWT